jgi:hypothetical protein
VRSALLPQLSPELLLRGGKRRDDTNESDAEIGLRLGRRRNGALRGGLAGNALQNRCHMKIRPNPDSLHSDSKRKLSAVAGPRNQIHMPDQKAALTERPFGFVATERMPARWPCRSIDRLLPSSLATGVNTTLSTSLRG